MPALNRVTQGCFAAQLHSLASATSKLHPVLAVPGEALPASRVQRALLQPHGKLPQRRGPQGIRHTRRLVNFFFHKVMARVAWARLQGPCHSQQGAQEELLSAGGTIPGSDATLAATSCPAPGGSTLSLHPEQHAGRGLVLAFAAVFVSASW